MRHIPRKRFGQHFLADESIVGAIIAGIAPQPRDVMVEIGPGLGALTRPLAQKLNHLHVIEIDRELIARLQTEFPSARVTVHAGDALEFDFSALDAPLRVGRPINRLNLRPKLMVSPAGQAGSRMAEMADAYRRHSSASRRRRRRPAAVSA